MGQARRPLVRPACRVAYALLVNCGRLFLPLRPPHPPVARLTACQRNVACSCMTCHPLFVRVGGAAVSSHPALPLRVLLSLPHTSLPLGCIRPLTPPPLPPQPPQTQAFPQLSPLESALSARLGRVLTSLEQRMRADATSQLACLGWPPPLVPPSAAAGPAPALPPGHGPDGSRGQEGAQGSGDLGWQADADPQFQFETFRKSLSLQASGQARGRCWGAAVT